MELAATAATPHERKKGNLAYQVTRWLDGHGLGKQVTFSEDETKIMSRGKSLSQRTSPGLLS